MLDVALKPLLLILAALALVLVNGVFVAVEFAIVRVRRTRLEELAGQGVEAAKDAILIVDYVSEYLAVTQIGVTIASLGVDWLAEDACTQLFLLLFPAGRHPIALFHAAAVGRFGEKRGEVQITFPGTEHEFRLPA